MLLYMSGREFKGPLTTFIAHTHTYPRHAQSPPSQSTARKSPWSIASKTEDAGERRRISILQWSVVSPQAGRAHKEQQQ